MDNKTVLDAERVISFLEDRLYAFEKLFGREENWTVKEWARVDELRSIISFLQSEEARQERMNKENHGQQKEAD